MSGHNGSMRPMLAFGGGFEGSEQDLGRNEGSKNLLQRGPMADWRKLFSASTDQSLHFYPPQKLDNKVVVSSPSEVFEKESVNGRM